MPIMNNAVVTISSACCFLMTYTKECFMSQTLLEMAKDLVMAQIAAHRLSPEEMHQALQHTYTTLQALQTQEDSNGIVPGATPETPAAPIHWKKSITKLHVICMECGASFKQLSVRHLKVHGLDARAYRAKYRIPQSQPLSARSVTAIRKEIVQKSPPWEKAPTYLRAKGKTQEKVTGAQRKRTARAKA
jgi:predicted transcriptional regulator